MKPGKKMDIILLSGITLVFVAGVALYFFMFQRPNPPLPTAKVVIASSTPTSSSSSITIASTTWNVEVASTTLAKTRGLSFRTDLPADHGMIFIFGTPSVQTFWMKDMHFPLDMIWIGGGKVLGFEQNAPPPAPGTQLWNLPIYTSPDGTDEVLEVNAGTVAKYNIKIGDTVQVVI